MRIRVGHLYPEYLNIYADRGNIAVLARRAALRGHELHVEPIGLGDALVDVGHDLLYVGGGQDREQYLVAPDLAAKGDAIREAVAGGAALLAVCGGYQLLGRGYRGRDGSFMEGRALRARDGRRRHEDDRGRPARVRADPGVRSALAGFENHAGRTVLDPGAVPLGRVVHGFGNDGASGFEGCRVERAVGTYLHGPLLPETRGSPTGSSRRRSHTAAARRAARPRAAPGRARGGGVPGIREPRTGPRRASLKRRGLAEHPGPPPAASVTRMWSGVGHGPRRKRAAPRTRRGYGTHISPR